MGPERLAAKNPRLRPPPHPHPIQVGRRRTIGQEPPPEEWHQRYPVFPRLLFALADTGPAGVDARIAAVQAAGSLDGGGPVRRSA
ncbi:hypothetical protein ABT275_38040 [Streptomyces sp. NPDC001185]|uniref:hypothetical protein n=1 Tax=Streptomyces sp. NPDC001185 TaxID=3154380 RepID=UPI00331E31E4